MSLLSRFYRVASRAGTDLDHSLQWAAKYGQTRRVKALLEAGANLHTCDDVPLRLAAWEGHTDIVKILLDAGANAHAGDDEAYESAQRLNHTDIEKLLAEWLMRNSNPSTPLCPLDGRGVSPYPRPQ